MTPQTNATATTWTNARRLNSALESFINNDDDDDNEDYNENIEPPSCDVFAMC